jgi:uncharacterized phage protein (TIGR02218 family)
LIRDIHPELKARLQGGATTLCRCWRLKRGDGVVMGFTDHDRTLEFEGVSFRADTGLDASAIQMGNGLSVDNGQAVGALSDVGISEADLAAGRYDGAEVDQWLVDWTDPELRFHLFRGSLGEIRRTETSFEAELRGLEEKLNVPIGRTIKRGCDAVLGDKRCGVEVSDPRFSYEVEVAKIETGGQLTLARSGSYATGWFTSGTVRWLSGSNAGLTGAVWHDRLLGTVRVLQLAADPGHPVSVGDRLLVIAGCDRRAETCRTKFDNFLNFRGFPHIPGEDWVLAYPKSGEAHDGSSLVRR